MSDEADLLRQRLEQELLELQLAEQQQAGFGSNGDADDEDDASLPSSILPRSAPELAQLSSLWSRFRRWTEDEGASAALKLNSPASVRDFFLLQRSLAPEGAEGEFELPQDVAAHFATHDGQDWTSVTGVMGRWHLLDAAAVLGEWRDQCDMVEMGLYSAPKYDRARKALPAHARIDTSTWFNPGWIPLACSGGRGLGGDLICVDLSPRRSLHRGQIILYRPESAERILLAESWAEWIARVVDHLEAGVYRFDTQRGTYVAGRELSEANGASAAAGSSEAASATAAASSSSSSSATSVRSLPMPTRASSSIGVEAFLYSALEGRDLFIANRQEELVFLNNDDFGLLSTEGLGGAGEDQQAR